MSISLDKATLEAALVGYQQHLHQIEAKMADLRRMLGNGAGTAVAPAPKRGRKSRRGKAEASDEPRGKGAYRCRAARTLGESQESPIAQVQMQRLGSRDVGAVSERKTQAQYAFALPFFIEVPDPGHQQVMQRNHSG